MKQVHRGERGQVLIILTLGIITLLGFTALAIDGGRLYGERRHIQGVADTSSLTGALYIAQHRGVITSTELETARDAALFRAASNGYDSSVTTVTITKRESYYYVETVINSAIDPVIAQIVYRGPLKVGAVSEARVLIMPYFADGEALYAMSKTQKNALEFTGNADIEIIGTGIFSNSNHSTNSISFGGSSKTYIEDTVRAAGGVNVGGEIYNFPDDGSSFTKILTTVEQNSTPYVPTPECSLLDDGQRTTVGGEVHFTPGIYSNITENGHTKYSFAPGFYCINGAFTTSNGEFFGEDVSFYVATGNVSLAGTVNLSASNNGLTLGDDNWDGMLLHVAQGRLTINGNADSDYVGTIYVPTPGNPSCKLNGSSDSEGFSMQLVCDSININGDGVLVIHYDQSNIYQAPVPIDLVE